MGVPPPAQEVANVTGPPPAGNCGGLAVSVQPDGAELVPTVTVVVAGADDPAALEAVTENVDVAVTLTTWLGVEVVGFTLGPVHV